MQILHPFAGSIQQYAEEISDPDRYRPDHCPQCAAQRPLTAHGFYTRTVADVEFDGVIRVRRYLCHGCKRTVSLLPEFALPYLRFSILVISLFLVARLLNGCYSAGCRPSRRATRHALPARPVLGPPFSTASRCVVRGPGSVDRPHGGAELRRSGPCRCCQVHRLDSPRIVSCSRNCAPTCWAGPAFSFRTGVAPRSGPRCHPPEGPHTAFASRQEPVSRVSSSHGRQS